MTELTESNDHNNTYDETKCPLCNEFYNEDNCIPRILLNCGHTICTNCILNCLNSSSILKCPEDSTEYNNISSISSFPINKALLKLLHKISESKKIREKPQNINAIITNFKIPSPTSSPYKGLKTFRNSLKNFESLKKITLSNSKYNLKCNEHPNRNLEMICLEEICKICTNCAIFGRHKNHNVINIDEFIKDVEGKAGKLLELFENINEGAIKKDINIINEKSKDKLSNLLEIINEKYTYMENVIHEFTQNLIEKVKKDENLLLNEISSQFDKLKGRVNYYLELPNKINMNLNEWKEKVKDKMNALNDVKDISEECLKFVDCYGENLFNKLIKGGNNIISDVQKIISFPTDEIHEDIKNLNLTIEKQILNQEFFHINKKLDFGDLCEKYEIPKKEEEKENPKKSSLSKDKNIIPLKEITHFEEKEINDDNNSCDCEKKIILNPKINNDENSNILNINQINNNNITQDTENGNILNPCDKLVNDKNNFFLQKEMELENIQFGDDSFLFTDLDLIGFDLDTKNKNKNKKINELPPKNNKAIKAIKPLNLHGNKHNKKNSDINDFKKRKSVDNYNLISHRNNISYDKDSFDSCLKKTPTNKNKILKKTKSNIVFNKSPSINRSKSKSKSKSKNRNKCSQKISKDTKTTRDLSPFGFNKLNNLQNLFKKSDKINLSRNELGEEIVINLVEQIKKNKEKVKEIKLIKCGIKDDGAIHLLKAMENCQKLTSVNLANNSLSDKVVNNIVNFLKKNSSISSCYFTNNTFSLGSKEKIKSYNRNGKIKIFV